MKKLNINQESNMSKNDKDTKKILNEQEGILTVLRLNDFFEEIDIQRLSKSNKKIQISKLEYVENLNPRVLNNYTYESLKEYENNVKDSRKNRKNAIDKKVTINKKRKTEILNNINYVKKQTNVIVIQKELANEVISWLDNLNERCPFEENSILNLDIAILKRIFKVKGQKHLVLDGNTYCATIESLYQNYEDREFLNFTEPDIEVLKQYHDIYLNKETKCDFYSSSILSENKYHRDIQMLQLIALVYVLNQKAKSWKGNPIKNFEGIIYRLCGVVTYMNLSENDINHLSFHELMNRTYALRSLITDGQINYAKSKELVYVDFKVLNSLFIKETNEKVSKEVIEATSKMTNQVTKFAYELFKINIDFVSNAGAASSTLYLSKPKICGLKYFNDLFCILREFCIEFSNRTLSVYSNTTSLKDETDARKRKTILKNISEIPDVKTIVENMKFEYRKMLSSENTEMSEYKYFFETYINTMCNELEKAYKVFSDKANELLAQWVKIGLIKSKSDEKTYAALAEACVTLSEKDVKRAIALLGE